MTGRRLKTTPATIDRLELLHRAVFGDDDGHGAARRPAIPGSERGDNGRIYPDNEEIIQLASNQRRGGARFSALWSGHWNAHFNSASEADSSVL